MIKNKFIKILLFITKNFYFVIIFFIHGCVPLTMGSSAAGLFVLGNVISKPSSTSEILLDCSISNSINFKLLLLDNSLFHKISIHVLEGNVLCIGCVDSDEEKNIILEIISSVNGVENLWDEIEIKKGYKGSFKNFVIDSRITCSIKFQTMLSKNNISCTNYNVITYENVVYLLGIANSYNEMLQLENIASHTKYVKKVRNYIIVKQHV